MPELEERVAVLEAHIGGLDDLRAEIRDLREEITKYRGFIGGVTFVIGCLGAFLSFGKDWLLSHWK